MTETGICSHNPVFWLLDTIYLFLPIWVGTGFQVLPMFEIEWHPHRTTWYLPSGFTDKVAPQKLPRKRKKKKSWKYATEFLKLVRVTYFFLGEYLQNPNHSGLVRTFFFLADDGWQLRWSQAFVGGVSLENSHHCLLDGHRKGPKWLRATGCVWVFVCSANLSGCVALRWSVAEC